MGNDAENDPGNDPGNIMESLISSLQFENPAKRKETNKQPKSKDIQIIWETDSQDDIIKKLVLGLQKLRNEFEEYNNTRQGYLLYVCPT